MHLLNQYLKYSSNNSKLVLNYLEDNSNATLDSLIKLGFYKKNTLNYKYIDKSNYTNIATHALSRILKSIIKCFYIRLFNKGDYDLKLTKHKINYFLNDLTKLNKSIMVNTIPGHKNHNKSKRILDRLKNNVKSTISEANNAIKFLDDEIERLKPKTNNYFY